MAAPQSAHRSVFVGNIPYDVTEEQLKEICEEVGPVVSFRLVVDRETGKPKGYGFCEYKDEETAASARRNLSGYEINGRQLRVDFAENGKNADKNREQGRGGPGMASTADHQKQIGGTAVLVDAALHHPLGVSLAVAGANIMAQALGGAQNFGMLNHLGLPSQQVLGTDPLTQYLAKMSRNQLSEIISEVKDMATQNKEQARQVLLAYPTLPKALFQAQIMLGIVPAEMLQMPNVPQISALPQFLTQPQTQLPQLMLNKIILPGQLLGQSPATLPSIRPQPPLGGFSFRPHQVANSSALKQQIIQPSLVQDPLQVMNSTSLAHVQPFQSIRSQISDQNVQISSLLPDVADLVSKDPRRQVTLDPRHHPSKLVKLNDGRTAPPSITTADMGALTAGPSTIFSAPLNHVSRVDKTLESGHHATQMVLPPEVDPALLQQVLHLTPEQLSSLAPDQQQQVRQLQEMLRRQSTQLKK